MSFMRIVTPAFVW